MKKQSRLFFAALVIAAGLLAGCGSKNDAQPSQTPGSSSPQPSQAAQETKLKSIGNVYEVKLTNATQKGISGIAIKSSDMAAFPENMLAQGDVFAANEVRVFYCVRTQADLDAEKAQQAQATATAAADNKQLGVAYDVQITYADGTSNVLHGFPFGNTDEVQILMENNISYITYVDSATNSQVSTKEAEAAVVSQEQAAAAQAQQQAAEAAAQAQQQAEAAAQAQQQAEAAAQAQQQAEAEAEAQRQAEAEAEAQRQAEAEAEAQRQAEAEAEAQRQAEAEAEARRQAEAEAAAAEAAQQDSETCIGDDEGLFY